MGVEVQLFYVKLKIVIDFNKLNNIFQELGCEKRSSYDDEQNYEIFSKRGVTELQVMGIKAKIKKFYIRFSFGNPASVIDQTLDLFKKLSKILSIEIYDSESMKKIALTDQSLDKLKRTLLEKKKFFDEHYMKIDKPIRGGKETFDYIRKHKK